MLFTILVGTLLIPLVITQVVVRSGRRHVVDFSQAPNSDVAIVLGAYVQPDGQLSAMLEDRVLTGVELYRAGKVRKLLMTGDHGFKRYDEVGHMRRYAESLGVPPEDIFMDHAGFSTYESMYRAREVFQVESAIIVTQRFHLPRALYTARALRIEVSGVPADRRPYSSIRYSEAREILSQCKAFVEVNITHPKPTFLGAIIPITGDGRVTHD